MRSLIICAALLLVAETTVHAGPFRRYSRSATVVSNPRPVAMPAQPATWSVPASSGGVATASFSNGSNGAVNDGLAEVNAERARRGLRPFLPDPQLAQAASTCAQIRASRRIEGHLPNDFSYLPAGSTARSAGCGALEPSWGWGTCCTYENYTYAGAAWVMGVDGKRYMHLFVR
ncbi:MAG: hypothetical protein ACTHOU_16785 [Aureliella sp.]